MDAIFFDLDGTLIDSEPLTNEAIVDVVRRYGGSVSKADEARFITQSWKDLLDEQIQKNRLSVDRDTLKAAIDEVRHARYRQALPLLPGAREALLHAAAIGPVGIVTGSYREDVELVLSLLNLEDSVAVIVASGDTPHGKPDPAPYRLAARRAGADPTRCLVFEETTHGLQSAKSAGMIACGVEIGNHTGMDLSIADILIPTLEAVTPRWLQTVRASLTQPETEKEKRQP